MLTDHPEVDIDSTNRVELERFVSENVEALQLAREGLTKECRMPLRIPGETFVWPSDSALLNRLATALCLEARSFSISGDINAAAGAYMDAARVGHQGLRGGLLVDHILEIAVETVALQRLRRIVDGLGASQCRQLIAPLMTLVHDDDEFEAILERDRAWARNAYSSGQKLRLMWEAGSFNLLGSDLITKVKDRRMRNLELNRQLILALAARAFELENGRSPQSAEELVPAYLEEIPKDPETGAPLNWDSSGGN
jgi:hypothetical protein